MATEAEILANITALEAEMLNPVQATSFENRSVQYKNPKDIEAQISYLRGQLDIVRSRRKQTLVVGSKGF